MGRFRLEKNVRFFCKFAGLNRTKVFVLRSSFFVRVGEWVSQSVLVWRVGDLRLETRGGVREPYVRTASSSHDYHDSPEFHSNVVRGARGPGVSSCGVAWALGCYYYYYEYECWFDCVDGDGGAG